MSAPRQCEWCGRVSTRWVQWSCAGRALLCFQCHAVVSEWVYGGTS